MNAQTSFIMELPQPQQKNFHSLVNDIKNGQIKIPQFQRDFVWPLHKSASLLDSIVKGYPIGTFIFWRTKERLRSIRNLGDLTLPELDEGESVDYVLDGQQRLTSLFACLEGKEIERESGKKDDFSKMCADLSADEHSQIVITENYGKDPKQIITIKDLISGDFELLASYAGEHKEKLKMYKKNIENYQYSIIQVKDTPIDIATEIFTRINVGGKPLSVFEIMVAKTFDHKKGFDLSEKYKKMIDKLQSVDYETVPESAVLQTVSVMICGDCDKQSILKLDKGEFIKTWENASDAIERTVGYFKDYYRIPVSQLLPYKALIIPFSYFFSKHKDKPTDTKRKLLQDFFWRCSLSGRYSSSLETLMAQDIKKIDKILKEEQPEYDWPINTSPDFIIRNGKFYAGSSYIKAILCIYAYFQPKSFNDNSVVNIGNNYLKQANSRNYHHFFPRSYLRKNPTDFEENHIINIAIVDDFLNKREIRDNSPSKYMKKFQEQNGDLAETMKTHLVDDLSLFGVWNNDYKKFIQKRANRVSEEIEKRIIKRKTDNPVQDTFENDEQEIAI